MRLGWVGPFDCILNGETLKTLTTTAYSTGPIAETYSRDL